MRTFYVQYVRLPHEQTGPDEGHRIHVAALGKSGRNLALSQRKCTHEQKRAGKFKYFNVPAIGSLFNFFKYTEK